MEERPESPINKTDKSKRDRLFFWRDKKIKPDRPLSKKGLFRDKSILIFFHNDSLCLHHSLVADDADDAPLAQSEHVCEWGRQREESFPNVLSKPWWHSIFFCFCLFRSARTTGSCDVS